MELEQDFATIKKFLKYLPRHLKSKSLPRLDEAKKKKPVKEAENLSINELRDRLKKKILELRQKAQNKGEDDDDDDGGIINKRIRKQRPQKPERKSRLAQADKAEGKFQRGRDKSQESKPKGKPKAKSQNPKANKKSK